MTPEVTDAEGEYSEFWKDEAEAANTEFLPWSDDGFDLEAVVAADPDLIIAGGIGFPLKHATDSFDRLAERSEEHTSELQSRFDLVCRLLLEKKKHKE